MTQYTADDRRTLIAMMCKIAWADGVVQDEERAYVERLIVRLGGQPVSQDELDTWLRDGVPEDALKDIPEQLKQMFFYEALRLAESDGDLDPSEQEAVEKIMNRVFEPDEEDKSLAQLARKKLQSAAANAVAAQEVEREPDPIFGD